MQPDRLCIFAQFYALCTASFISTGSGSVTEFVVGGGVWGEGVVVAVTPNPVIRALCALSCRVMIVLNIPPALYTVLRFRNVIWCFSEFPWEKLAIQVIIMIRPEAKK